ncbi:MAG: hypothetical protein NC930_00270 [Candidatus Omnitrophica bacterium]|nr:hypothetical protein [Candidatus Omnitrophota bacterium]
MTAIQDQISQNQVIRDPRTEEAIRLEREAQKLLNEKKIDDAFKIFDQAGNLYRGAGEHLKVALCFTSAATYWNIHTGWQPLRHAAVRSEWAAHEAAAAKYYDCATQLFRDAALRYEKEGDYARYSACYVQSKDAHLSCLWQIFSRGVEFDGLNPFGEEVPFHCRVRHSLGGCWGWSAVLFGDTVNARCGRSLPPVL